ncbi:heme ABC exporter ATP-binding protein CcmA [Pseudahrensia aquimaris]|uniref:Heme ABC exporter ATP-binding protein CcmA n=1 Tax=Pseudahrensia aquimaris TaxID=744461 RepID=A0ABW3FFA5_9HYPH
MRLVADNLTLLRGEDVVLHGLSFDVASGSALVITGENGTGKSTLLRGIAGLLPIEAGTVGLADKPEEFGEASLEELCHYLGPDNSMKGAMSVGENLAFWQDFAGQPFYEIEEALEMVGLGGLSSIPFSHLSTGMRRRASIARLLISYRPIWLLDEPTSGMDAVSQKQFADLMGAHLEDGGIVIAATHISLGLDNMQSLVLDGASLS